ncbi:restriction endonuclease subunit S [Lacticaseibacillus paracasei]|uniref:restriction endonuclease subunit S n=1 Tax=Lacticaseibacillus paracasei TaxID=1597 RepID=UPI002ADEFAE1|nr:restriction endonuclease subunit S [Lacticaseibacillus paracasei]MEA1056659.1 restriction endonuclease subunit S [Lacticaseibacillus paracasei]
MKDNQAKYPQLRFKGFTDPWVQRQVGDFLTESRIPGSNGAISKKLTVKLWGKGVIPKETVTDGSEATKYYVRKAGQFMYGKLDFLHAAFGIVPENLDGYESTLDSPAFDIANLNSTFLMDTVMRKSFYLYQGNIANGSRKAKRIHVDTFSDMPIDVPTLDEQDKIGYFFDQLDNLIAANQRKLDLLKEQKKGYLQKMFPKNGAKVPELRFAGFADAWEQRKLGDLGLNISDGDWIEKQHIFENGQYRIIQTGNIGVDEYLDKPQNAKYFRQEDFNQLKANEIFPGDIVVCRLADPAGRAVILPNIGKQMVTSVDVAILRPSSRISFRFLVSQLNNPRNLKQVQIMASGSTRTRISRKNLEREIIQLPNINEQKKIGSFFSILNSTIALHQRKLEKLQELKKGYLQKMFC